MSGYDPGFIRADKITYAVHMDRDDWSSEDLAESAMLDTGKGGTRGRVCLDCSGFGIYSG